MRYPTMSKATLPFRIFVVSCFSVFVEGEHGTSSSTSCASVPRPSILSYHIHVLFMPSNRNQTMAAMNLQREFGSKFHVTENCTFDAGNPMPGRKNICRYEVDWVPAGPFPTAQYSFFVPTSYFVDTVPWIMQHRDDLDVLVHPNSGCETEDHLNWPLWGGHVWELDSSIFNCEYPGCSVP